MAIAPADRWESFARELSSFNRVIGRAKSLHVSAAVSQAARELVQLYFREARIEVVELGCDQELLGQMDRSMQRLLRLSNGRNRRSSYIRVLETARPLEQSLTADRELRLGQRATTQLRPPAMMTDIEVMIAETLRRMIPAAALSYEQAVRDLSSPERISFRGTANELRETLREVLDYLAPDDEVMSASGFQLESGQTTPTQRQKTRHILRSRRLSRSEWQAAEETVGLVEERTASVARSAYQRSNLAAHVATARREVKQMKMYVDSVLAELLEIHA